MNEDKTFVQRWQKFLNFKYQELERVYNPLIDELSQKLHDSQALDPNDIPDFDLFEFSFIKDWLLGIVDSRYVYDILSTMNFEKVAEARLTRRLTNYMISRRNPGLVNSYIIPVKHLIMTHAYPLYVTYLKMMLTFFSKVVEVEKAQMKLTWISQVSKEQKLFKTKIIDYTFNQTIRKLDSKVIPFNDHSYFMGDNIVVLDECLSQQEHAIHWIFGPKIYIDHLKKQFKIQEKMDIKREGVYIKNMIKAYINA